MQEERLVKQEYLYKEIIENNYSPEEFTDYCENFKGSEIDSYTLEELEDLVRNFQGLKSPKQELQDLSPDPTNPATDHQPPKPKEPIYSIQAVEIPESVLSTEPIIQVKLNPAEALPGGMFSYTKYTYPISTQPFDWNVKRQVDDFIWLRQILSLTFPGSNLPPFPPKKLRSATEASPKQQYFLERFINSILMNPLFRRSTYLQTFLVQDDMNIFNDIKKKSSKEKKIGKIEESLTIDGKIICDDRNDESEKAAVNEYLNITEALKKKIKKQCEFITNALIDLSKLIAEVGMSLEILENAQELIQDVLGTKTMYRSMKHSFYDWADHELKCSELLRRHFGMFFKYSYCEILPLKELCKERDIKFDVYDKNRVKLMGKKEKLWNSGDFNKWGLSSDDLENISVIKADKNLAIDRMLVKETIECDRLKDEFAFFNNQCKLEIRRYLLDNQLIENLHFSGFALCMCGQFTSNNESWGALITNLSRIRREDMPARPYIGI